MSSQADAVDARRHRDARELNTLPLLLLCFFLSGTAALIYQTAWLRQFALVFGTSELAVATVLAAYMAGLALGAYAVERWLQELRRPVLGYALIELGIAASAIALVPVALWACDRLLLLAFGGQASPPSSEALGLSTFYLAATFIALALPTALMGATLPLLARQSVREEWQIAERIGLLYCMNTAGAVLGALLAAFVLLPQLGLARTVWGGAAVSVAVFLMAWLLTRRLFAAANDAATARAHSPALKFSARPGPVWVLPLMCAAGSIAFLHEVLWTRMLAHIVGSSIHAFAVMVASFLAGIALGGGAGAALARSRQRAVQLLALALLIGALWAPAAFWLIEHIAPAKAGLTANSYANSLFGFALLLPLTIAIGSTYPLAVRIVARDVSDAALASARVYAWNTLGGIVGALAGGYWLIPALRYEGAVVLAAAGNCVLAALALLALEADTSRNRRLTASAAALLAVLTAMLYRPAAPTHLLLMSPLNINTDGRLIYYAVGRSASVTLMQQDGGLVLRTNGLP